MKTPRSQVYVCPETRRPLRLDQVDGDSGRLVTDDGSRSYDVRGGIPDLVFPRQLPEEDQRAVEMYDRTADVYDEYLPLTFMTFNEDEEQVRERLVDKLELSPSSVVLETGCGTGRDSEVIARRLGADGRLYLQDLCPTILAKAVEKLSGRFDVPMEFAVANGYYLPFPDNFFDATYHFGGLNTFGDIPRAFAEMTRVTKPGGKVVVGDESMPVWLRQTEFGKVLMNSNPHYRYDLPLAHLPVEARNVRLEWIIGGVFYVIDYRVGEGEPQANLDFEIPGARGGTHRTRYYGHLEGITPEAVRLAHSARAKTGMSMHAWLDQVVRDAAKRVLDAD